MPLTRMVSNMPHARGDDNAFPEIAVCAQDGFFFRDLTAC